MSELSETEMILYSGGTFLDGFCAITGIVGGAGLLGLITITGPLGGAVAVASVGCTVYTVYTAVNT